ncbi:integrase, partial [Bacillus sp. AFS076308]
ITMPKSRPLPNLAFPSLEFGFKQTPWDLSCLLYLGAAKAKPKTAIQMISLGQFGRAKFDRLELVSKIHEAINDKIVSGGSNFTTHN